MARTLQERTEETRRYTVGNSFYFRVMSEKCPEKWPGKIGLSTQLPVLEFEESGPSATYHFPPSSRLHFDGKEPAQSS